MGFAEKPYYKYIITLYSIYIYLSNDACIFIVFTVYCQIYSILYHVLSLYYHVFSCMIVVLSCIIMYFDEL